MALAEATVRVVLDANRFERELRDKVQRAVSTAGRNFDRELRRQMAETAKTAGQEFRTATRESMLHVGRSAAQGFDVAFRKGLAQTTGRVGQRLGQGLRVSVGRAGIDAGRRFAQNMSQTLAASGQETARAYSTRIAEYLTRHFGRVGRATGQVLKRSMRLPAAEAAAQAGREAGREFSLQFGVGSARVGRPIIVALAAVGVAVTQSLVPATGILAGIPPLLAAVSAAAGVTAVSFMGISDALDAVTGADIEGLTDSMEKLAPAAQAVVREFAAARPELLGLQQDIQNAFFSQIQGMATQVSSTLTGELRDSILSVAEASGAMARAFANAVISSPNLDNLNQALMGTGSLIDELVPGIRAFTDGLLDMAGQAAPGLRSISRALSSMLTSLGQWMSQSANSGKALEWIEQGIEGVREFASTIGDLAKMIVTLVQALNPLTFVMSSLFDVMNVVLGVFEELPGPVQSLALALLLLRRTNAVLYLQTLTDSAQRMGATIREQATTSVNSYRNMSTALRSFTSEQRVLTQVAGQAPTVISRFQASLDPLRSAALVTGTALKTGLSSAVSGLYNALGGGWGVLISGAVVALGALAQSQQEAKQRAAEHRAEISQLADTLSRQTGAVTAATRELLAEQAAADGMIQKAKDMGIAADDFLDALTGQESALGRVQQKLAEVAREQLSTVESWQTSQGVALEYGITLDDVALAAAGNEEALRDLAVANEQSGGAFSGLVDRIHESNPALATLVERITGAHDALDEARITVREAGEALGDASSIAVQFADAVRILSDETADADAKARALTDALHILAGGTVTAEAAQGRFTELLARLSDQLEDSTEGLDGMGSAMVTNEGRINTQTQAGAFLIDTYQQLTGQLSETAVATVEAGRASGDLDGALKRVAEQTQAAREQFISTATQLGLNQKEAERLADAYGLIPAQVLTTVTDQGSAQNVRFQVLGVYQQLNNLPPNTPVRVEGLTEDAIRKLEEVGIEVEELPDGSFKVTAETAEATQSLRDLVASWSGTVIRFVAGFAGAGFAMGGILPKARGGIVGYAEGGTHRLRPMSANRAEIVPPDTWRVIGDRAVGDEAYIPITKSARSQQILATTARRMGFDLVPAGGGRQQPQRVLNVDEGAIQVNAPFADPELVARATINELARYATT